MTASRNVDEGPPGGGRFDEAGDATRRTYLALERTYLAWWRTGLTSLTVALAFGKIAPELTDGPTWPSQLLGVCFALLGVAFIVYGLRRDLTVAGAVRRGAYAHPDRRVLLALTAAGVVLGVAVVLLVIADAG
ncbi:MAG: hypothetical protein AVDCRST_MAG79-1235 [uncultured Thermoleophilia bacterium]|uniref:DUF202 domain-containing protein n=1 Tax=uncultured Thermoleophilia bacterium TaxID=1497501 RepID=A0A6J4TWT1_9ACTN|nr:MAG: hypothetical protein AVDCRST_MAG79-1235 [uncultured Thermoleophilia bacterium]